MSKYTTTIKQLVETGFDLGLRDYPIFNENYRSILNQKIIEHYYFREIGFETAGRFKFHLNVKMREIMVLYNQRYKSEMLSFTPLTNINTVNNSNSTDYRNNESEDNNTDKSLSIDSRTPQSIIFEESLENGVYAESARTNKNESTNKNKSSNTGRTSNYDKLEGYSGISGSELLNLYRDTFLNIDMEIIEELSQLFMNIY